MRVNLIRGSDLESSVSWVKIKWRTHCLLWLCHFAVWYIYKTTRPFFYKNIINFSSFKSHIHFRWLFASSVVHFKPIYQLCGIFLIWLEANFWLIGCFEWNSVVAELLCDIVGFRMIACNMCFHMAIHPSEMRNSGQKFSIQIGFFYDIFALSKITVSFVYSLTGYLE